MLNPNTSKWLDRGELFRGVHLFRDRPNPLFEYINKIILLQSIAAAFEISVNPYFRNRP